MTCTHRDKRSVNGEMGSDGEPIYGGPPENAEEPAWCRDCGALWSKHWVGWAWSHPLNDREAPTLGNMLRERMTQDGPPLTRLRSLKERLQDKTANRKTDAAVDEIVRAMSPEERERIEKAAQALDETKKHGITIDQDKLAEVEKALDEVERRKTKMVEAGARRGTKTDIAFTLAKTSQSLLNNDHVLGLVLLVAATKGSLKGDGPLEIVYVRDGHPEAAQELQRTLDQRLPADLAWAEKTAAKEEGH